MQTKMKISIKALTDTDKKAKENENKIMYLTNTIENLKKDMIVVNIIKTAAVNEFEFLRKQTGREGMRSKLTTTQKRNDLYRINTILDRTIISVTGNAG